MSPEREVRRTVRSRLLERFIRFRAWSPERMAAYAREQTEFYGRFYEGYKSRDFESLPVLTKQIVREESPYDLLSKELARKVVYYGETTGSTGSPTPSFFTELEFHAATLLTRISPWYPLLREGLRENRTALNGLAFGFTVAGMSFSDLLKNAGALVANTGSRSTLATPPRIARGIARLLPSVVAAAPIDFLSWMRIVREDHPDQEESVRDRLGVLVSTAELCAEERGARIAEHFGIEMVDVYACVEGFFSLPCPCGQKHVLPLYHVELFDDDLQLLGTEGTGRIAFTNLLKRSSPMVRYLLDDLVTISRSACPHGFDRDVVPHGRHELSVRLGGETLNVRHFENEIFRHGLFGDWRVEIGEGGLAATIEEYAEPEGAAESVGEGLAKRFGLPARVDLVPFGEITDYRAPRREKPILKLRDLRESSSQEVPEFL